MAFENAMIFSFKSIICKNNLNGYLFKKEPSLFLEKVFPASK